MRYARIELRPNSVKGGNRVQICYERWERKDCGVYVSGHGGNTAYFAYEHMQPETALTQFKAEVASCYDREIARLIAEREKIDLLTLPPEWAGEVTHPEEA